MTAYIVRRLLLSVPVLWGLTVIVFAMINMIPGDPATYFVSPELAGDVEQIAAVRHRLGLDQPLPVRYLAWLGQTLRGDLGYRSKNHDRISTVIWSRLKASALLIGIALTFGVTTGIALGVLEALRAHSIWDYLLSGLSSTLMAIPSFITGIIGLYVLSLRVPLFPAGGIGAAGQPVSLLGAFYHVALPALLLSLGYCAIFMRLTRFSVVEVLGQAYIVTAQAKGLRTQTIVATHALRNALLPVVTLIGFSLPDLAVGALFIETIFSWPGMGALYLDAVQSRDYLLLMGMNLVTASVVLLANVTTDVAYALVDPRIRYR